MTRPGMTNVAAPSERLKPFDARLMRSHPVSTRNNHVVNHDADCCAPVGLAKIQDRLFPYAQTTVPRWLTPPSGRPISADTTFSTMLNTGTGLHNIRWVKNDVDEIVSYLQGTPEKAPIVVIPSVANAGGSGRVPAWIVENL